MKVIVPLVITDEQLLSSNVPGDDYSEWNAATTYVAATPMPIVQKNRNVYVLAVASSTGDDPEQSPDKWKLVGVVNMWRMFDSLRSVDIQTRHPESIVVELKPGERINSLALFGLSARSVNVQVFNGVEEGAEEIFNRTLETFDTQNVRNWYDYFFSFPTRVTRLTFFGIPPAVNQRIVVSIENGSGIAGCGKLLIGKSETLGCTYFGVKGRRKNLSVQERDAFGGLMLSKRRTVKSRDYVVKLKSVDLDYVDFLLGKLYGSPTVFVGSDRWAFATIYGIPMDSNPSLDGRDESSFTLTVEEI